MWKNRSKEVFLGAVSSLILIGATTSVALAAANPTSAGYTKIVQNLTHNRLKLVKTVPTGITGLTGLVTQNKMGKKQVSFGLDGKYIIPGPIIGTNGKLLNAAIAAKAGLKPTPMRKP